MNLETKTWLTKAYNRKLIPSADFKNFITAIDSLGIKLNNFIKSIGKTKDDQDEL